MNSLGPTYFSRRRRPLPLLYALGLCLVLFTFSLALRGSPLSAQSSVLLAVGLGVDYDIASFGRVLDLDLLYRTGDPLTETCSDMDPEDVVLTLELPVGTTFVAETDGSGVYDPVANTVTWELGTLDRLINCFGTVIRVTIQVDQAVPDGTMLTASTTITTSTPGDDPAGNTASVDFQGGMLPLDVELESVIASCQAGGDSDMADDGQPVSCSDSEPGWMPAIASVSVGGMGSPRILGQLHTPLDWVAAPHLTVHAKARGGYDCDNLLESCWALSISTDTDLVQDVVIHNPNPFEVPVRIRYDSYDHAGCSDNEASFPGSAFVEDSLPGIDCGASYEERFPSGRFLLDCDGISNTCLRVTETHEGKVEEIVTFYGARVPPNGSGETGSIFQGDASGDSNVFYFPDIILIRTGYGYFNGVGKLRLALAGGELGAQVSGLRISAVSPVDLLLTDRDGNRAGKGPDEEPPDPGDEVEVLLSETILSEIPGAQYSGPEAEPEAIMLGLPESGSYQLDVTGTGDGPFTLTFETLDDDDQVISQQTITGDASEGSSFTQMFTLDASGVINMNPGASVCLPLVIR